MLHPGELEPLKAHVHRALGILSGICAVYNGAAWIVRRERHLLINTMLYGLLWAVEQEQVKHHANRSEPR